MDPLSIQNYSFDFPNAIRRVLTSNPDNEKNKGYKVFILSAEVVEDLENEKLLDAKSLTALKRHRIESYTPPSGACEASGPVYVLYDPGSFTMKHVPLGFICGTLLAVFINYQLPDWGHTWSAGVGYGVPSAVPVISWYVDKLGRRPLGDPEQGNST